MKERGASNGSPLSLRGECMNITRQEVLHQLEALCTAEEPAACTSICPLHIDAREICRLVGQEDFNGAFKLYQKQAPFALILAYTCSAPCERACLRRELGGAIQMSMIEELLAREVGKPGKAPVFLAKKTHKVAIVGGSLRGLSAAHDLARKGYQVTVFEKSGALGGKLLQLIPKQLPQEVFESELKILNQLKVRVERNQEITDLVGLRKDYDGIYVATSAFKEGVREVQGTVYDMFLGRREATTLDRQFQGVNTEVGREREGSYETTLFTNLEQVIPEVPVTPSKGQSYTKDEGVAEARRCLQCKCEMCVERCGFLQKYGKNPRQYVREVYNNLSIAMGTHHANQMINTCALCGQCEAICPNGLDMSKVFLAAREKMVATKKMPQSAFEFGLLDLEYSLSEDSFLGKHQPGFTSSEALFFPGCQLGASEPELVKKVYQDLCQHSGKGVGLMLSCCAVLAKWAGDQEAFQKAKIQIVKAWEELGKPVVITACPTCKETLNKEFGMRTESLFEVMMEWEPAITSDQKMVLHHACGGRHDEVTKKSVVDLASRCHLELMDREDLYEESPCCGYGGLVPVVDEGVANQITEVALNQLQAEVEIPVLTYCVNCRDRFLQQGKEAFHLLELFYRDEENIRRKSPTWSERRDNRRTLKRQLLRELWEEVVDIPVEIQLFMSLELTEKLEKTHILHSDIATVIGQAEATNERLVDPDSGHYTAYRRIGNVTFWVEYVPVDKGYQVFNSYSHRMEFVLDDSLTKGR